MSTEERLRPCDWCGAEDEPTTAITCGDGSIIRLCADCYERLEAPLCPEHGGPVDDCEQCRDERETADDQAADEDWPLAAAVRDQLEGPHRELYDRLGTSYPALDEAPS